MSFGLLALDLDGTTLGATPTISPRNRAAVATARERGFEVVLVTGRHHVATRAFHADLGLTTPAICCNGTYVYDFLADRVVTGAPLGRDRAQWLLAATRRHGTQCVVYSGDAMNYEEENPRTVNAIAWAATLPPALRPLIRRVESFDALIEDSPIIWKVFAIDDDPLVLAALQAEASAHGGFSAELSWYDCLDLVAAGNTKGARLVEWAGTQGFTPDSIVAIGDNHNDISMFDAVGLSIAMGNADPEVKAAATLVTEDNVSDGVARAIERLLA